VSRWANRFIWAAIIQGLFAVIWTLPIIDPFKFFSPPISMVIASGSAGTWFLVGYVLYLVVGVIGVGLTALFYNHFEVNLRRVYRGITNKFAWLHLVLMNVGTAATTWLLMYDGYMGEKGLMPTSLGGLGLTPLQVHEQILVQFVNPIGALLGVTAVGVLFGGLGFLVTYFRK
jgi:hypothetical protein